MGASYPHIQHRVGATWALRGNFVKLKASFFTYTAPRGSIFPNTHIQRRVGATRTLCGRCANTAWLLRKSIFLVPCTRLYNSLYRSIGRSVSQSIGQTVGWSVPLCIFFYCVFERFEGRKVHGYKCPCPTYYCPTACDKGCRVYGLVYTYSAA